TARGAAGASAARRRELRKLRRIRGPCSPSGGRLRGEADVRKRFRNVFTMMGPRKSRGRAANFCGGLPKRSGTWFNERMAELAGGNGRRRATIRQVAEAAGV